MDRSHRYNRRVTSAQVMTSYAGLPVCVTGGAGFIGSHLVDALVKHGAKVSVIDDLSNGRIENLSQHANCIQFVQGSILDEKALREAMRRARVVFHEAALGSVPMSVEQPVLFHEVNATGTLRVLEEARRAGVERVVYAASSSAYGDSESLPKRETDAPSAMSPYAASKLAGEDLIRAYANCYEIDGVSLRYFNIFGPRQRADSAYAAVVPAFIEAVLHGRKAVMYGDGGQTRDFTYVANAVAANLLAGASAKPLRGSVINIACGERYSLLELLRMIAMILDAEPAAEHRNARPGDIRHSQADIGAAKLLIGYQVEVNFEEGLRQTIDWFHSQENPAEHGRAATGSRTSTGGLGRSGSS
jgi:UDP-glucose 4-epimerase